MYNHEPKAEFIQRLEQHIGHELRRRQRSAQVSLWSPELRKRVTLAASVLTLVSMTIGAAATAVAYQAKDNAARDLIVSNLEQRRELARQAFAIAQKAQEDARQAIATGAADQEKLAEATVKLAVAKVERITIESQLSEVTVSAREPSDQISAPVFGVNDFVGERLRLQLPVVDAGLKLALLQYENKRKAASLGFASPLDVDAAQGQVAEARAASRYLQEKINIRQQFVIRRMDATRAELQAIENDAEQRRVILQTRRDLATTQLEVVSKQARIGDARPVQEAEAKLKVQQLESDIAKAEGT